MDKLISEQAAIDIVEFECGEWSGLARTIVEAFEQLPPEQPERKTGKWIWQTWSRYMCSECGRITDVDECMEEPMYTYCPYCGVPMVAGEKML